MEQKSKTPATKGRGYLKGVKSEFKKVIWPTKKETINYTSVVILISVLVGAIVYGLDLTFTQLLNLIILK